MILNSHGRPPPRVSVVLPAYNAEKTIGEALASVFAQTYRDFEVIVVDDGSMDGTEAAVAGWRADATYIRQPNGGPGRARNAGIRRARGELVAFLDADDVWLPDKLARQVEYFDEFPATGLLHTAAFLDATTGPGGRGLPDELSVPVACSPAFTPPSHLFCEVFETEVEIHTLTVVVPKSILDEAGGFDERREVHVEDWDLWLRIAARHPVGYLRCPLAIHRDGGVMSASPDKTFTGQMLVIEKSLPEYQRRCAVLNRTSGTRLRTLLYRVAWELGRTRFERNEMAEARLAFRDALRHRPLDLEAHFYHLASHLPSSVVERLRRAKRRHLPARGVRIAGAGPWIGASRTRRARLTRQTLYRRARRRVSDRLRDIDNLVDTFRGRPRRVLFEATLPQSADVFKSLYRRLRLDPRIEFYFASTRRDGRAEAMFRSLGIFERVIPASEAAWMKLDASVNTDFHEMPPLHRCSARLHLFHGIADRYGVDAPVLVAPDVAAFDAMLFPNHDRLDRYVASGLVDAQAALLVGSPRIDSLVDGSLDQTALATALRLRQGVPTILYAPASSPELLPSVDEAVIRRLMDTGFNVLVKLPDPWSSPPQDDWMSRSAAYANPDRLRIIRDLDEMPWLMVADALVTNDVSIGCEFALLDRPMIVIDGPGLTDRAFLDPDPVRMLRSASEVIERADDLQEAIVAQLANPLIHADDRRRLARRMFYRPGTATERAVSAIYDALGLRPMPVRVEQQQDRRLEPQARRKAS